MSDKDENIIEERVFNIPLRGVGELIPPREERRSLRSSIEKHMKIEAELSALRSTKIFGGEGRRSRPTISE